MTTRVSRLANGLTVATEAMPGMQSVSLGAWIGVGTRDEPAELNGVAHFLEHMVFKGTGRRSAREIAEEIEAVGGHINAYTGRENTAFYAKVLSADLELGLDIIADLLTDSLFDPDDLTRERAVILQEIGQAHDTPDDIIFDHFQETAYPEQALGRPVLGRADTVAGIARDSIRDYMGRHYSADRMVLVAAGDVGHEPFADLVAKAFAGVGGTNHATHVQARYQGGEYREHRDLEQIHLVLGFDSVGYHDSDYYPSLVFSTLFGGGMSSRLFQEVRERRGLVYSIYSFVSPYGDGGLFGIYAGTGEADVEELIPVVCDEICQVGATVSEEEVERARAQLRASVLMARESNGSRAEQLGQQILAYGTPRPIEQIIDKIDSVELADVTAVAARLLASRPTFSALGPIDRVESFDRLTARLS